MAAKPKQERVVSGVRGFNLESFWDSETREHQETFAKTAETLFGDFEKLVDACELAVRSGGKILFFGNGGSAADAQHLATELAVRYKKDRPAIAAIALTTDTSALTAIGNDFGFDRLFARQIEALGKKGDIAIGISTSGKSENVLNALKSAKEQGLVTAGLTGGTGGKMTDNCDIVLCVPSKTTARIQEMHIMLGQMLCGALELRLGLVEE